jgi:hypothetical protein
VAEFLVEVYVARSDGDAVERGASLGHRAAEELTLEGRPVRLLRSILVPEDETCFYLYEATAAADVAEAARRAELRFVRVAAAESTAHETSGQSGAV